MAKFTMKKLVTVCKCLLHTTERITKMFPMIATNMKTQRKTPRTTTRGSDVKFLQVEMLSLGSEIDPLRASAGKVPVMLSLLELLSDMVRCHKKELQTRVEIKEQSVNTVVSPMASSPPVRWIKIKKPSSAHPVKISAKKTKTNPKTHQEDTVQKMQLCMTDIFHPNNISVLKLKRKIKCKDLMTLILFSISSTH